MDFKFEYEYKSSDLLLEISPSERDAAWQGVEQLSPCQVVKAYLNRLCVLVLCQYLAREHPKLQSEPEFSKLSDWLEGAALDINGKKVIIIPTESFDLDEMRSPAEWVEIPSLAGDYFLAASVDLESQLVQFSGFATHARLKQKGSYDERDRTYSLDQYELIEEMSVLFAALKLCPDEQTKGSIEPLPPIDSLATKEIHDSISAIGFWATRRKVPEAQWKALLNNESTRKRLLSLPS